MNKIIKLESSFQHIYLKTDFHISHTVMPKKQPRVFVRIEDDCGNFGLGEAAVLPFFNGEEAVTVKTVIDEVLFPELMNLDTGCLRKAIALMNRRLPGNNTAKTAVEMALWDLAGKVTGLPVYQLLGGLYREQIELAYVLSLKELPEMVKDALAAREKGYKTIKTKLTGDVRKDLEIVTAVREAIGDKVNLRADANSAYSVKDALFAARSFEPYRLEYLEQPCSRLNPEDLKYVKENTTVPIAADESLLSITEGYNLIKNRVVDHLVIKLIKVGGIMAGLKIAELAETAGLSCTVVSPIETSIGMAAGLTLASVAPAAVVAHELNSSEYLVSDPATGLEFGPHSFEMTSKAGKPGLGIELKEDIFEKGDDKD